MMCFRFFSGILLCLLAFSGQAQYYYKDILLPAQNRETWKAYSSNKVKTVSLESIEKTGEPTPGFICSQTVSPDYRSIQTFTQSAGTAPSVLQTDYDASGRMIKTTDSSDSYKSVSEYRYNAAGAISSILNSSLETDNHVQAAEIHQWIYQDGKPLKMIKIKNGTDTSLVNFVTDAQGRVTEERPFRGKEALPAVYYYYDTAGRLTDIVRYNNKAARLLPDYVFEYNERGVSSMIFVPAGSGDYQKWLYEYDGRGLKIRETGYDKHREMLARIQYVYSFR